jgi:signal transduction histidine kinase
MLRIPTSLKITVPLMLLGFAATLSAVNLLYHVPKAEAAAEEDSRKRMAQEMSRLQSTLEYLLLKGDTVAAQREIAVLAHNHDVVFAAMTDERNIVTAATRRAWLDRPIGEVLPQFAAAAKSGNGGATLVASNGELIGRASVMLGSEREELRPSRIGSVLIAYDLARYKAEARAQVEQQSLYWAGWVTALALAMWLVFHFLLTRRTAQLVGAAEQIAAGNFAARSGLKGTDELGRLSRAFDAMARQVADNHARLEKDIEDKKRAAEELARQRETLYQREKLAALGSLLAGVSHELNNPLSVVVARSVMLEEQGDPATRAAALKIRTAAERCARIVRTFLAMARQQKPERGPVAINDVVTAALELSAYAMRTSSVEIALDLGRDLPPIHADADQLHQVLLNLLINAQQSLQDQPPPRRVRITSQFDRDANAVNVTVADNGPGIAPHNRARIFEPYFTTKPIGSGTGVGLAVSLGIVEAHGGTLTVATPREGGAAFTMTLPAGAVQAASDEPELWDGDGNWRSILIVDDEPDIRDALAEILTDPHHRVVTAASGREALERMTNAHFDVVLTDIRMPDIDGRALFSEIERRWPGTSGRVVFVTGDTLASTLRDFVSESGRPVIEKPFLPSEVRRVVAEVAVVVSGPR